MRLESFLFGLLCTSLMFAPVMHYILVGWPWKQNDIFVSMSSTAKQKYLKLFQRTSVSESDADESFDKFYFKWYGRRHLVIPIIFVAAITFVQSYFVGETIATRLFAGKGFVINSTAIAGFVGVYIWVCLDFITRYSQRDLTSGDIYRGALRLLSGVAVGYAFAAIVKDTAGPFIAFAVGVFPLQTIQIALERLSDKYLSIDRENEKSEDKLTNISGIDRKIYERIQDTWIFTITQLAYCDPVQVAMGTNLNFTFINDLTSQALAWIYFGKNLIFCVPWGYAVPMKYIHL